MVSRIREALNKIRWHKGFDPRDYEVHIVHRGAPGDVKVVPAFCITEVLSGGFKFKDADGDEKAIPYHRVLLIRNRVTGKVLFSKKPQQSFTSTA
jgi:uncharacterized protein (UPF0248 family)